MELQKIDKKWWLFGAAILVQFIVMFYWVMMSDNTVREGTVYKFRLMGYDPHDPFRGEYLRIQFKDNTVCVPYYDEQFDNGENVYATFEMNGEGFARPVSLSEVSSESSLKVRAFVWSQDSLGSIYHIAYPFTKYWMNQEECPVAESIINHALNANQEVYALVSIKDGKGVVTDVEVEGVPIKILVQMELEDSGEDIEEDTDETVDSTALKLRDTTLYEE